VVTVTGGVAVFPNPAAGNIVTLQVTLAAGSSEVRIEIFTLSFRKVNEIVLKNVPAGVTRVTYDLTDSKGSPLANGLYYIVVRSSQGRFVTKMLVLR
jgi:flagellar hook assembly protein FlgD